jgi:hypothetical protein
MKKKPGAMRESGEPQDDVRKIPDHCPTIIGGAGRPLEMAPFFDNNPG